MPHYDYYRRVHCIMLHRSLYHHLTRLHPIVRGYLFRNLARFGQSRPCLRMCHRRLYPGTLCFYIPHYCLRLLMGYCTMARHARANPRKYTPVWHLGLVVQVLHRMCNWMEHHYHLMRFHYYTMLYLFCLHCNLLLMLRGLYLFAIHPDCNPMNLLYMKAFRYLQMLGKLI